MKFLALVLFFLSSNCLLSQLPDLFAQPYYAAMKGISCSACHVNPSGAGVRKISEGSPTFINNAVGLGVDLRGAYSNDGNPLSDYYFKALEQRIYLTAEPAESLIFAYANESGSTAEAYGILQKKEWFDFYVRFGRFFLPYGLQVSDPDNSAYIKTGSFAPKSAGFSLQPGVSDIGLEIGFAPKKLYFVNFSVTNGSNKTGSGSAKAVTGRGGILFNRLALGVTGFQASVPSAVGQEQVRYGGFGWLRLGSLVLLGEIGQGSDIESSTQTRKFVNAAYAELNYKFGNPDSYQNDLMLKAKFETTKSEGESVRNRYTLGLEWFLKSHFSVAGEYRFLRESPETPNDQALVLGHLWF